MVEPKTDDQVVQDDAVYAALQQAGEAQAAEVVRGTSGIFYLLLVHSGLSRTNLFLNISRILYDLW